MLKKKKEIIYTQILYLRQILLNTELEKQYIFFFFLNLNHGIGLGGNSHETFNPIHGLCRTSPTSTINSF